MIWEFFSKHSIEEAVASGIENEGIVNRVFPNPIANSFRIELENDTRELFVYNAQGKRIAELASDSSDSANVDSSTWLKGVYFIAQLNARGEVIRTDRLVK